MASITRANVRDCLKNAPRDRVVLVPVGNGKTERRVIKRPEGRKCEEFVNPQGNVVWFQLLKLGTNEGQDAIDKERAKLTRSGFVEFHKCPLRHGTRHRTEKLEEEFAELPAELQKACSADPVIYERRGRVNYMNPPCKHIAWLIEQRRARAEEARRRRASQIDTVKDIEAKKLEVAQQQLEETRKVNERLVSAVEQLSGQGQGKGKGKAKDKGEGTGE